MLTTVELVQIACLWEATARKIGNVHPQAHFQGTTYTDFLLSAIAIGPPLSQARTLGVGPAILQAVESTQRIVKQNTNLGIILLLSPLCAVPRGESVAEGISHVLMSLSLADSRDVYQAIRLANPGGLGTAPREDVQTEPTLPLLEVMRLAATRDQIASEYATHFSGVIAAANDLVQSVKQYGSIEAGIIACQLHYLQASPDSLIQRKCGLATAESIRQQALAVELDTAEGRQAGRELDAQLRSDGNRYNPGTTADLITAALFIALRENKISTNTPFPWHVEGWI